MSESGYFLNFYNGLSISVYSWQFWHLLFTLTWPFFYPFCVISYLFVDNNNTAMCVDMLLEQEGSACHTSHHHTQPQCPSFIYRRSVSPWCLTGSTLSLMFINTLIRIMYHTAPFYMNFGGFICHFYLSINDTLLPCGRALHSLTGSKYSRWY